MPSYVLDFDCANCSIVDLSLIHGTVVAVNERLAESSLLLLIIRARRQGARATFYLYLTSNTTLNSCIFCGEDHHGIVNAPGECHRNPSAEKVCGDRERVSLVLQKRSCSGEISS